MAKRFRKKNRQLKVTIDIPDEFESDTDFMEVLQTSLDERGNGDWCIRICDIGEEGDGEVEVPIHSIQLGDVLIGPDDDEEEE